MLKLNFGHNRFRSHWFPVPHPVVFSSLRLKSGQGRPGVGPSEPRRSFTTSSSSQETFHSLLPYHGDLFSSFTTVRFFFDSQNLSKTKKSFFFMALFITFSNLTHVVPFPA